jgi:hypothetical protein
MRPRRAVLVCVRIGVGAQSLPTHTLLWIAALNYFCVRPEDDLFGDVGERPLKRRWSYCPTLISSGSRCKVCQERYRSSFTR